MKKRKRLYRGSIIINGGGGITLGGRPATAVKKCISKKGRRKAKNWRRSIRRLRMKWEEEEHKNRRRKKKKRKNYGWRRRNDGRRRKRKSTRTSRI